MQSTLSHDYGVRVKTRVRRACGQHLLDYLSTFASTTSANNLDNFHHLEPFHTRNALSLLLSSIAYLTTISNTMDWRDPFDDHGQSGGFGGSSNNNNNNNNTDYYNYNLPDQHSMEPDYYG
jgi:hypothetical protein